MHRISTTSVYRRALFLFRPFAKPTLVGIFFSLIGIAFNLLKPWPFKIVVDDLLLQQGEAGSVSLLAGLSPSSAVLLLCLALVLIHLLAGLLNSVAGFVFVRTGLQVLLELRTRLYATLQALSLKFHEARASADSSFRVAYD